MSSRLLLNTKILTLSSSRKLREPQRCVSIGTCGAPRNRQRRIDDRAKHIYAAIDLQQSTNVSTGRLQDGGAAVEVSHVSMAFGDRRVKILLCFVFLCLSNLELPMPQAASGLD